MGKGVAQVLAGIDDQTHEVIILCRSKERGQATIQEIESATQNNKISMVLCDLTRLSDVRNAIQQIHSQHAFLDGVFINAGLGYAARREETEDGMDPHFQVNYLSQFMLIGNDQPGVAGTAARLAYWPENQNGTPPSSALAKEKVEVFSFELLAYRTLVNEGAMPYSEKEEEKLPDYFIAADDVSPMQHVDIQAAAQKWVDSSISKTANVPTDYPFEENGNFAVCLVILRKIVDAGRCDDDVRDSVRAGRSGCSAQERSHRQSSGLTKIKRQIGGCSLQRPPKPPLQQRFSQTFMEFIGFPCH